MTARCQAPAMIVQCFYLFLSFLPIFCSIQVHWLIFILNRRILYLLETVMLNIVSAQHLMQPADGTQFCWKKFYITVLALSGLRGPVGGPSQ